MTPSARRSCLISRSETAGVTVRFPDGGEGYVPRAELYWQRGRDDEPRRDFKPEKPLVVVPTGGVVDGLPTYSHKWTDREPWERTLAAIAARSAGGRVEVVGKVIWAQPDRAYVHVPEFKVDAVLPRALLPLDEFPNYTRDKLVSDLLLFDGDEVRAVVESTDAAAGHVVLNVRAVRDAGVAPPATPRPIERNPPAAGPTERAGDVFDELKEIGSPDAVAVAAGDWEHGPALVALLNAVGFAAAAVAGPPGRGDTRPAAAVLDVDRALSRDELDHVLRGWAAAAPDTRLVLLHSGLSADAVGQLRAAGGRFHGAARKWGTPKSWLAAVRSALDGTVVADEPADGTGWREWAMADAIDHERTRDDALDVVLHQLLLGLGATTVALVHFDVVRRKISLVGSAGRGLDFDVPRLNLEKSTVRNIVEDHEVYRVTDTFREDAAYHHLYDLFPQPGGLPRTRPPFRSFLGMRLVDFGRGFAQRSEHDRKPDRRTTPPTDDRASYALMAFHSDAHAFPDGACQLFCRTAVQLLTLLEREAIRRELVDMSALVLVARQASFLVHEFRNRTTAVQTWNRLLEAEIDKLAPERAPGKMRIDQLRATSSSLGKVAGTLAQVNEVFLKLSVEGRRPFRIGAVLEELRLVFRDPFRELRIRFEVDLRWDGEVVSNRGHLTHVVSNLIQNAIDQFRLTGCGRPELRVTVEYLEADAHGPPITPRIKVTVTDNGVGIPQHQYKQVFDYRFSTKPDGTGIGLHVGRLIAAKLDGTLVMEASERFVQTRFAVTLPA